VPKLSPSVPLNDVVVSILWTGQEVSVTLRVSNPYDYVNHVFKRP
jgi:hypothetical protein